MGTARQIIQSKSESLATLPPEATVLDAAKLMNTRHIGSVLVVKGETLVGIFTERDVMRRVVAEHRDPETTPLETVMTTAVAVGAPHTTLNELRQVMRKRHIRHVPIVENDHAIGMISIGDLNQAAFEVQEQTIQYLERYMSVS